MPEIATGSCDHPRHATALGNWMLMMFTDASMKQYEEQGAVTIDTPFTTAELDRAEAAWDRLQSNGHEPYEEPGYLDMIQHPYLEEVAGKVLRAEKVHLWWGLAPLGRFPAETPCEDVRTQWETGCHVDVQATLDDFEATPRRMRAELWLWLTDVPAHRGAMRILPGSHRSIMEYWGRVLQPEQKAVLPRVHGLSPAPVLETQPAFPEYIPDMGDKPWVQRDPIPAVAKRGQILVICSAGLHSAWQNEDTVPRKSMGTSWAACGVQCGLPKDQRDAAMTFLPALKTKLREDRAHIVSGDFDWLIETNYEPKWPETFLPTHDR